MDKTQDATILLFGGHVITQTKQTLDGLIHSLAEGPNAEWILETVAGLTPYWDALTKKIPEVAGAVPGARLLAELDSWLQNGLGDDGPQPDSDLPNIVVGPLLVAIQLDQYWRYLQLQQHNKGLSLGNDLQADLVARQEQPGSPKVEILGFCAGLIGALAASSSANRDDFKKYGATAIRLGMLIGAMVDAREEWDKGLGKGGSVSYATAWRSPKQAEDMRRIVSSLSPEAYIAVLYDDTRATITTSERTAPSLVRQLRGASLMVAEIGIKGHIHTPGPERKRHTDALIELCNEIPGLQYTDAAGLALPTFDNQAEGKPMSADRGNMTEMVLRSILVQQCDWYGTFSAAVARQEDPFVVAFGLDRCIPPTLMRRLAGRQVHFEDIDESTPASRAPRAIRPDSEPKQQESQEKEEKQNDLPPKAQPVVASNPPPATTQQNKSLPYDRDAIAVVGMSVKTAGADDLDEFVEMLKTGQSQHRPITRDMLMHDTLFRESADADPKRKFYGNFMRDSDAFDHKFFKRSPRESQAIDPQSRLCLESAYQAVEQSGYFAETTLSTETRDKMHVGVYLGNCGVDYEHNITCHQPNAFTATGGLKSFIVGRLSHYFGWTGPSVTFDTACSSSAVAIHTACRNLLSGECSAALCGGVNIITNMLWLQNLAAGSFLSPTGQCKPFDDNADGYCRAEAVSFVFLKKMSDALADGNPILATIPATAVYQNENCTPLFVPNTPSLSHLFKNVVRAAGVSPGDISLVEAHGTGTPVGDPAEYESVRLALAGPTREKPLPIGSVKGHIGHTEGASGMIALIKVIMMMREGFIPPQASFNKLNHSIDAKPDDNIEVVTSLRPWSEERKIALINNYGACGSNASMVVVQPPSSLARPKSLALIESTSRFPFWIAGLDARSIAAYSAKLAPYIRARVGEQKATLADLSYLMSRQSNRSLPQGLVFSCASVAELEAKLSQASSATKETAASVGIVPVRAERPVILCFGGQVSTFVGLDRKLYDSVAVLRRHLDQCDAVIVSEGLGSIYPDLFSREPVKDTVKLQTMLFATQYACAKSWMDSGLQTKVAAVVGHSFGEITALCVSGVLSLQDTVRLVAGRAKLVRDAWGPDSGAMMAIEADESVVSDLLQEANRGSDGSASIACYNGPRSFTLAGSTKAIDSVAAVLASGQPQYSSIKSKRLNVTNAFHSSLVDKVVDGLGEVGKGLTFHEPVIPFERATETSSNSKPDWTFVPSHMRKPVFFNHALQRLAKQYSEAIFLEAGSSSTITIMASRALAPTSAPDSHHFQAMSITNDKGLDGLADATVALWKQGLRVLFWAHHAEQALEYADLLLPPYQFDKTGRHWLPMKSPVEAIEKAAEALIEARGLTLGTTPAAPQAQQLQQDPKTLPLWSFVGYLDKKNKKPRFRVNTTSDKYNKYFAGHVIAQTAPICPATLQSDMAIEALFSLHPEWKESGISPTVRDLVNHAPICADNSRAVYMDFAALDDSEKNWAVTMLSVNAATNTDPQTHVEVRLHYRSPADPDFIQEFGRLERLVSHVRCQALLTLGLDDDEDGIDVLRGRNVYRAFSEVVDYPELYRGVRCVIGKGYESAGIVHKRHQGETWLDVPQSDSFSQVGGMWVNLMTDSPRGEMYIATGCEASMRSPKVRTQTDGKENGPGVWHVFAQHSRVSDKAYTTDVFVFDASTGLMTEAMLGVQYSRVPKASMSKMLARLTKDETLLRTTPVVASKTNAAPAPVAAPSTTGPPSAFANTAPSDHAAGAVGAAPKKKSSKGAGKPKRRDITEEVRDLVANVSGIEASEFTLDTEMADLGIDSLMGMELAREVEIVFKCTLDQNEQMEATSLRKFIDCVQNALDRAGSDSGVGLEDDEDDDSSSADGGDTWSEPSQRDNESDISIPGDTGIAGFATPVEKLAVKPNGAASSNLKLFRSDILECFGEVKLLTDTNIIAQRLDTTSKVLIAGSNRLCAALVVEALEELGMPIRTATPGQPLERVPFLPQHGRLMACVYEFLEQDARLVDIDIASGQLTRTHVAPPRKTSKEILDELVQTHPDFAVPNRLTYYCAKSLAGVLSGKTDGIRVIFGTAEGRELVQAMYCDHTFNRMNYYQMRDVIGRLAERVKQTQPGETLKVLEMGAGTGGTTHVIAPFLASLGIPVEYTFTDLSPSMVANARRKFGKQYHFMRFAVHDIEKPPADEHKGAHIVLASNAIHATHSLAVSLGNVRQALRDDGFLMILEMTEVVPFIDLVFGLLEGWWLYDDGRTHAVVPAEHWEREMHAAGFGHVDWTDGNLPENAFQKVIMALASGPPAERLPKTRPEDAQVETKQPDTGDVAAREAEAVRLAAKYAQGWNTPDLDAAHNASETAASIDSPAVVIVTGATGSLGSHLVQQFAENPDVATVVCVNRPSSTPVKKRQADSFTSRGIELSPGASAKLRVLETDTSKLHLGLASDEYAWLSQHVTHIVHNAWPMSGTRAVGAFEPQLQALRNLLDLARDMATTRKVRIGFQFVSSIGVVGYAPYVYGQPRTPEQRVPMSAVMPGGYTEAKWACERMMDETLHKYPRLFRPMVVRPGQIAGSTTSGFWNPVEHFAFLVKSAQALRAWPDFDGIMQWLPVDKCAGVMADLLKIGEAEPAEAYPVYHIDNPVGQPWKEMSPVLAAALDIPPQNIIPFKSWIQRVRRSPLKPETENPASRLVDFLDDHFERMSCGGLIMDTQKAKEHSRTMADQGPVSGDVARRYVAAWKKMGFLNA